MKKMFTLSLLAVALAGCSTATTQKEGASSYDPVHSARIRLFGQNGKPTIMYVPAVGSQEATKVNVGGGMGDAFGSLIGMSKNETLGIAQTLNTRNLAAMNGILSKAFYREFVIPAGATVKIKNALINLPVINTNPAAGVTTVYQPKSCDGDVISFVPKAGKDYEVGSYASGTSCSVRIYEVKPTADGSNLVPLTE